MTLSLMTEHVFLVLQASCLHWVCFTSAPTAQYSSFDFLGRGCTVQTTYLICLIVFLFIRLKSAAKNCSKMQVDRHKGRGRGANKQEKCPRFSPGAHSSTENTSPLALVKVTPGLPPLCWHRTGVSLRNSLGHSCPPTGVCGSC